MTGIQGTCIAFDAYGTLFDVYAVGQQAEDCFPGSGAQIAEIWRVAQIDYTRLRTMSDRYADFAQITADALDFALAKAGVVASDEQKTMLMDAYQRLRAFPENLGVLQNLKEKGCRLAILSNGTPGMLQSAIDAAGMQDVFEHVLSVDVMRKYKTMPQAYQLAADAFDVPKERIVFVSSNGWDACGATWFGFKTFWVNRAGNPLDRLGVAPNGEGRDLSGLLDFVENQRRLPRR